MVTSGEGDILDAAGEPGVEAAVRANESSATSQQLLTLGSDNYRRTASYKAAVLLDFDRRQLERHMNVNSCPSVLFSNTNTYCHNLRKSNTYGLKLTK